MLLFDYESPLREIERIETRGDILEHSPSILADDPKVDPQKKTIQIEKSSA